MTLENDVSKLDSYDSKASRSILGTWKVNQDCAVTLVAERIGALRTIIGEITQKEAKTALDSSKIKCGIYPTVPQSVFVEKIQEKIGLISLEIQKKLAVFLYPSAETIEEIWVFEAPTVSKQCVYKGKIALEILKSGEGGQKSFNDTIDNFSRALDLQRPFKSSLVELEETILCIKRDYFHKITDSSSYLDGKARIAFDDQIAGIIEMAKEENCDVSQCTRHLLEQPIDDISLDIHYIRALHYENDETGKNYPIAIRHYWHLAINCSRLTPSLKKIELLLDKPKKNFWRKFDFLESLDRQRLIDQRNKEPFLETLIYKKDMIRMLFDKHLEELYKKKESFNQTKPTCFIAYNIEENDVGDWLKKTLLSDLESKMGIEVITCSKDFGPGKSVLEFEKKALSTHIVVLLCTKKVKEKYEAWRKACDRYALDNQDAREKRPGIVQEIEFAETRSNELGKRDKTFFIYLKGTREESRFETAFANHLYITLNQEGIDEIYNYYEKAFDLFGAMHDIPRLVSSAVKDSFYDEAKKILENNASFELEEWREKQKKEGRKSF